MVAVAAVVILRDRATRTPEPPTTNLGEADAGATLGSGGVSASSESRAGGSAVGGFEPPDAVGTERTAAYPGGTSVIAEQYRRIPIPAELQSWFEDDPSNLEFHEALERESRDAEWAYRVETDLREFINSRTGLTNINVLSVECRSKNCEILAIGYGDESFRTWVQEMSALLSDEAWLKERFQEPGVAGCGGGNISPGVVGLNCEFRSGLSELVASDQASERTFDFLIAESPEAQINEGNRIPVPEAFVELLESNPELAELHLRTESEPIDYSWSAYMENQLTDYMSSRPAFGGLTITRVECRTTLCEVQLVAADDSAVLNWTLEMPDLLRQSWHDLNLAGVNADQLDSGVTGMIEIFQRRATDGQDPAEPGDVGH